tara:strand:- start:864 stop:1175 length:312 start_codon:yes stop_codon:yes gene_type:complete
MTTLSKEILKKEFKLLCDSILDKTKSRDMLMAYANSYIAVFKNIDKGKTKPDSVSKLKKELDWYKYYSEYVHRVHPTIDAEASGFADGDDEYKQYFNENAGGI